MVRDAFRTECARLGAELTDLPEADFDRPTGCQPWTVRELLAHVRTGAGRLVDMLAAPAPPRAEVDAAGYYGAAKFTPEVDADRIDMARREAVGLATGAGLVADFDRAWRATAVAVAAQPPDRVVRTRHGDPMRLDDFLLTRVVEVGVHGLDLAIALGREPWLTPGAAELITALLLDGRPIPVELGWDRRTLVTKATGRAALTGPERTLLDRLGVRWLRFG